MSAIATHWLIFYMLLSSVHYNSKLNYKSHLLPMSWHHKLSPALCLARLAVPCKASRAPEKTVWREVPVCFSLNYGLVTSTIYIRPCEKWGVCSTIKESETRHLGPTWEPRMAKTICYLKISTACFPDDYRRGRRSSRCKVPAIGKGQRVRQEWRQIGRGSVGWLDSGGLSR